MTLARLKIQGEKYRGVITERIDETPAREVTCGGTAPGGPPPDTYRKFMPGQPFTRLRVEVAHSLPHYGPGTLARLKVRGVKSRGVISFQEWHEGPFHSLTILTIEMIS